MSSPTVFDNASHFTVQGSQINNVGRDHVVVTNNHYRQGRCNNRPENEVLGKRLRAIPSDDVFFKGMRIRAIDDPRGSVKVVRTFHPAKVVGLGDTSTQFTVVAYQGPDANNVFKNDALQYSGLRHPNVVQLFAILRYDSPMMGMILHGELVPLQHFAGLCAARSPLAFSYLKYRFSLYRYIPPDEFWIQPTSGLICMGPLGPLCSNHHRDYENIYALWPRDSDYCHPENIPQSQLDFGDYVFDEAIIKHVEEHFDNFESFVGSHLGHKSVEVLFMEDQSCWFSFGSVIEVSENEDCLTLKWQGLHAQASLENIYHSVGRWTSLCANCDMSTKNIDGCQWTRVAYSGCQDNSLSYFSLDLESDVSTSVLEAAWLSQAGRILQKKNANNYELFSNFSAVFLDSKIKLILQISHAGSWSIHNQGPPSAYLFIAPVQIKGTTHPCFAFHKTPYFWSMDPSGTDRLSKHTQELLGLPSFEIGIFEGRQWSDIEYDAVSRYLKFKGLDPLGLDYARTRGYASFEVTMGCKASSKTSSYSDSIEKLYDSVDPFESSFDGWEIICTSEFKGSEGSEGREIVWWQRSYLKPLKYALHSLSSSCQSMCITGCTGGSQNDQLEMK
ncbi:hypothetical protein EV360DRAFT_68896 [Lentinula raphanica]|nr:hypothetical protein EV360DRAFT_68896 [Lentinula raphanica]